MVDLPCTRVNWMSQQSPSPAVFQRGQRAAAEWRETCERATSSAVRGELGLLPAPTMSEKKDDEPSSTAPMGSDETGAVRGGALAEKSVTMARRGAGAHTKRYTDELGEHWQKQFTEKAADPNSTAYLGHSSGFRDASMELPPPPIDAAPPTGAFESQLPRHRQAACQPPEPTLVAPPAAVDGQGGVGAPALFTPPPLSSTTVGHSPGGGAGISRYPEGGGIQSMQFDFNPPAPVYQPPARDFGMQDGLAGDAVSFHGGDDPRWDADDDSDGTPTGPPIEVVKKELRMFLNAAKARVLVDQNAQVAAGGTCLLALVLLFFLGIWLLVFAVLAVCGGVGYRVHLLSQQPQRAAPGAIDKDF